MLLSTNTSLFVAITLPVAPGKPPSTQNTLQYTQYSFPNNPLLLLWHHNTNREQFSTWAMACKDFFWQRSIVSVPPLDCYTNAPGIWSVTPSLRHFADYTYPDFFCLGLWCSFYLANTPTYYTLAQVAGFDTCKLNSFQGNQHRSSVQVHTNCVGHPRMSWEDKSLTWLSPLQLFLALRPVAAPSLLPLAPPLLGSSGQSSWWA